VEKEVERLKSLNRITSNLKKNMLKFKKGGKKNLTNKKS
jgi:hypothetical protein